MPRKRDGRIRESAAKDSDSCAQTHRNLVSCPQTDSRIFALYASIGTSETWKVQMCVPNEVENAPPGRISLPWVTQGFSRASDETRTGSAPSFFARDRQEGKGKTSGKNRHSRKKNRATGIAPAANTSHWPQPGSDFAGLVRAV